MAEEQVTNEQLNVMIQHVKESNLLDDGAKYRAIQTLEEKRTGLATVYATKDEVDSIFGPLDSGTKNEDGATPKSDMDKLLDQILK